MERQCRTVLDSGQASSAWLESESIAEELKHLADESLTGKAGFDTLDLVSMLSGGSLNVNGFFCGLDQLLAMALGYERIRTDAAYESPSFDKAFNNTVKTGTTTTGCTATRIIASTSVFAAGDVGSYIRLENDERLLQYARSSPPHYQLCERHNG
ncbi:MAG: hypothetical protein IPG71_14360 [bacterium]|nr:hypothetical protein [bacterium]